MFGIATFGIILILGQLAFSAGAAITASLPSIEIADILLVRMISGLSGQVVGSASWVIGIFAAAWYFDRRRISDLGIQKTWKWMVEFGFGFVVGLGLQTGILLVGLASSWIAITGIMTAEAGQALVPWLVTTFIFYVCIGVREEVLFRGYLMTNLAESFTWFDRIDESTAVWIAVGVSSVFFSLWHGGRPFSFLILAGIFGLLFGTAYSLTGSITIPVGLHSAWNMAETSLFAPRNLPTSKLIETRTADPALLVGDISAMDILPFGQWVTSSDSGQWRVRFRGLRVVCSRIPP